MTHPLWLRRFWSVLIVLFELTEERPADAVSGGCPCVHCCALRRKRRPT